MDQLKLPIGVSDFRTIRTEGYCYVDKTVHIARLVEEGRNYFLSRPRRFGKSLLLDTLAELFQGSNCSRGCTSTSDGTGCNAIRCCA